jgi:carbon starvation protein
MEMLAIVGCSAVILTIAYFTYGRLLSRLFLLDDRTPTPANTLRDDVDYVPCETAPLLGQHFSAIAAAGPIVGPIFAALAFGWLPALLWILLGSIFIGGVHDFAALVASIRHRASSIIEVVRVHISHRAYLLFLAFVWLALVYIVVAFTDITASMFVGALDLETNTPYKTMAEAAEKTGNSDTAMLVKSGGVATSSLIYLILPLVMGLLVRSRVLSMEKATWVFLPLVGVAIWIGQFVPLNVDSIFMAWNPGLSVADANLYAVRTWDIFLLVYCVAASMTPMWLLLQPRGQLGGYFMYAALATAGLGLALGGKPILQPAMMGWMTPKGTTLFPFLFIMIACGACSGFHALIASGTTSKQLNRETSSRPIGYGTMLLEAMVAIVSLCCVMMLPIDSPLVTTENPNPSLIYANGIGSFLSLVGFAPRVGIVFALVAFNTFVFDTLDVCTRLGRFIIQELTGWRSAGGRWFGTILTAGVPAFFVTQKLMLNGKPAPAWRIFWELFGASNQLLAALTLLGVTVWLWRTRRAIWVLFVTGIPAMFMYIMSSWALTTMVKAKFANGVSSDPVAWIAVVLLVLAALMLLEGIAAMLRREDRDSSLLQPA